MGKGDSISFQAKIVRKLEGTSGSILGTGVSPDDKIAASCSSDNKIFLWDINAGEQIGTLEGHSAEVTSCSFSDEMLASGSRDGIIMLWKYRALKRTSKISVHAPYAIHNVIISPNGQFLASASEDGSGRIFGIRSGDGEFIQGPQSRILAGHTGSVNDVAFSSDSQAVVTCSNDGHCKIWDTVTGECLVTLEGHGGKVLHCGFKRDGRQIVAMTRMCVSVWSISKQQVAWEIEDKEGKGFQTLACHPVSSMFLLVGTDGTICGYSMSTKSQVFQTPTGHSGAVLSCQFSATGQRAVTGGIDGKLLVWI